MHESVLVLCISFVCVHIAIHRIQCSERVCCGVCFFGPFCVCLCVSKALFQQEAHLLLASMPLPVLPETVRGFGKVDERYSHVNPSSCEREIAPKAGAYAEWVE